MSKPANDAAAAPAFDVYSRRGCHLCELLLGELESLDRTEWQDAYGLRVPVVCCDGDEICQYNLDRGAVLERIS